MDCICLEMRSATRSRVEVEAKEMRKVVVRLTNFREACNASEAAAEAGSADDCSGGKDVMKMEGSCRSHSILNSNFSSWIFLAKMTRSVKRKSIRFSRCPKRVTLKQSNCSTHRRAGVTREPVRPVIWDCSSTTFV